MRGSLDDLRNFYHSLKVNHARALSTPVGPSWRAADFQGSTALKALQQRFPDRRIAAGAKVYACFASLSMGDKWAPAIARVSHEQVLQQAGALRVDEP